MKKRKKKRGIIQRQRLGIYHEVKNLNNYFFLRQSNCFTSKKYIFQRKEKGIARVWLFYTALDKSLSFILKLSKLKEIKNRPSHCGHSDELCHRILVCHVIVLPTGMRDRWPQPRRISQFHNYNYENLTVKVDFS